MKRQTEYQKAAILTWCYTKGTINYGQILQCYAMQTVIRRFGYHTTVIRYRKLNKDGVLGKGRGVPSLLTDLYELWHRLTKEERHTDVRIWKFIGFIKKNINLSRQCYTKMQVEEECKDCSVLFCGSDQIWHPAEFDDVYALDFGKPLQKRIAYAPSGVFYDDIQTEAVYKKLGECIEKLDLVTIREKQSKDILSKYTKKEIKVVVDPTLLLTKDEWNQIAAERTEKQPYIFCYFLGRLRPYKMLLKRVMDKYRVTKILFVTVGEYKDENEINEDEHFCFIKNAGPAEFIALVRDAEAVCTDSFHGMAFSIIYQRQFYVFKRNVVGNHLWASLWRQESLLEQVGIKEQRMIKCVKDLKLVEEIDYRKIDLEQLREKIKQLLEQELVDEMRGSK